jgi:hypothetical protein
MATPISYKTLLTLVADDELGAFADALGINVASLDPRSEIKAALPKFSRAHVLRAILRVASTYISMLRDVVCLLQSCASQVRTTGFIVSLPAGLRDLRFKFRPQVVNLLATFDAESVAHERSSDWEQALETWISLLEGWVPQVIQAAEVISGERMGRRSIIPSSDAVKKLFALWRTLDYVRAKLHETPGIADTKSAASDLVARLEVAGRRCDRAVHRLRSDPITWPEMQTSVVAMPWSEEWNKEDLFEQHWPPDGGWDQWQTFVEDVFLLAEHRETPEPDDLLRLELLKSRPQLFEVWLLSQVLAWYREWGCQIELLSLQSRKLPCWKAPIWRLSYANAKTPVARITSGTAQWYLYYQLRRAGSGRDNMPDLALASGRTSDAPMLWIADPKYAERGSYTLKNYVQVGQQYKRDFVPHAVWVCEYFPRPKMIEGFEFDVEPGVKVLTQVQPGGRGLEILKSGMRNLHRSVTDGYILAVDCSVDFRPMLLSMEESLRAVMRDAVALYAIAEKPRSIGVHRADPDRTWRSLLDLTGVPYGSPGYVAELDALGHEFLRVARGSLGRKVLVLVTGLPKNAWPTSVWEQLQQVFGQVHVIDDRKTLADLADRLAGLSSTPQA